MKFCIGAPSHFRSIVWFVLFLAHCSLSLGCRWSSEENQRTASEHDHEAEHEHHPHHWPDNFLTAIRRMEEIRDHRQKHGDVAIEEEFLDLIRWLPELVADTDLDKDTFDRIDVMVLEWVPKLESLKSRQSEWESFLQSDPMKRLMEELKAAEKKLLSLDPLTQEAKATSTSMNADPTATESSVGVAP